VIDYPKLRDVEVFPVQMEGKKLLPFGNLFWRGMDMKLIRKSYAPKLSVFSLKMEARAKFLKPPVLPIA